MSRSRNTALRRFLSLFILAATGIVNASFSSAETKKMMTITLQVDDLSEDGEKVSSHNDEAFLLVYALSVDSTKSPHLLLRKYKQFDSAPASVAWNKSFSFPVEGKLLIVLLEIDGVYCRKRRLEHRCRTHLQEFIDATDEQKKDGFGTIIGVNDLLGAATINGSNFKRDGSNTVIIKGSKLTNTYQYTVTITPAAK